jgi:hypothetical protein
LIRKSIRRLYAKAINDKRKYDEYSWGWLNRLVEDLFWRNPGAEIRPQYAWGAVFAAAQARALGLKSVALLEFGVAGGSGLVALQDIGAEVSRITGIAIAVYGFDIGSGLPPVTDPRDLPQLFKQGDYLMNFDLLNSRLRSGTRLILGNIHETIHEFMSQPHAPVGFVSFDVDLYTSMVDAVALFRGDVPLSQCLPRVICYLDDSMGVTFAEITGERLAVREYNDQHYPKRGISPVYGLRYHLGWPHSRAQWPSMLYWAHFLDHLQYPVYDGLISAGEAPLSVAQT